MTQEQKVDVMQKLVMLGYTETEAYDIVMAKENNPITIPENGISLDSIGQQMTRPMTDTNGVY